MKKLLLTLILSIVSINVMAQNDPKRLDAIQKCTNSGKSFMKCTAGQEWKNYK